MNRQYVDAIVAEMARAGVANYSFERGGKHPRVVWFQDGQRKMLVFPATPSDSRHGVLNMLTDLRRLLGTALAPRLKAVRSDAPRRTTRKFRATEIPEITVRADPMAVLAAWKPPSRFAWTRARGNEWDVHVLQPATEAKR